MVKALKFIICAVVVLLLFILYESALCAKSDYTFFVEERLMGRLLIANGPNRALKESRNMESENNRTNE